MLFFYAGRRSRIIFSHRSPSSVQAVADQSSLETMSAADNIQELPSTQYSSVSDNVLLGTAPFFTNWNSYVEEYAFVSRTEMRYHTQFNAQTYKA